MSVSEDVTATIIFASASFLGTLGMAVTGFGMALVFIAVYTIADVAGLLNCAYCDVKGAIFFQAIGLAAIIPFMLWASRDVIKTNASRTLLLAFIPGTIIGTPIGNILQDVLSAELIQLIVGSLVVLFSCFQVMRICKQRKRTREKGSPDGVLPDGDLENTPSNNATDSEVGATTTTNGNDSEEIADSGEVSEGASPQPPNGIKFWVLGFVLGWLAGFLGALTGLRSGPILIFFLHYQYSKDEIRSNMMIVTGINTYLRLCFYIVDTLRDTESSSAWFESDLWYVYLSVVLAGIIALPAGLWVNKKVTPGAFDVIVVFALLASGVINIAKGSAELIK